MHQETKLSIQLEVTLCNQIRRGFQIGTLPECGFTSRWLTVKALPAFGRIAAARHASHL